MQYTREDGCRAWLTYGFIPYHPMREMMEDFGCAEAIYDRFMAEGDGFLRGRVAEEQLALLRERSARERMHDMMLVMRRHAMGIVYLEDEAYPAELRNLSDPPVFLYYCGDLGCLSRRCVTMVGGRIASNKALEAAEEIALGLGENGVTVVSGMAVGIDGASHKGCVNAGGASAGVMACGLDVDYPIEHDGLKKRLLDAGGVLLSEYAPGTTPRGWFFPVRNRILAGLSRATMMVECRIRSGSMTTVQHALDQGREVFAWPGIPGTEWAEGAHQLIREGARYATGAADILDDLGWLTVKQPTKARMAELPPMTQEQKLVYAKLKMGSLSMDELSAATRLDTAALSTALTMLQLMGLIRSEPGKMYSVL